MGSSSSTELRQQDMNAIMTVQNNGYGLCQIVSFKQEQQKQYILKTQFIGLTKQYQDFTQWLESYKCCNSELVVQLIGTRYQKGGFCSSSDSIQGLFQYLKLNLKQDLEIRRQNQNPMRQKALLSLISTLVNCCFDLELNNINFGYIDPQMVFIKKQNTFKLCVIGMLFQNEIILNTDYFPPQQDNINYQKYRVFMIGLIAIQCLTLKTSKQLRQMSYDNFKRMIYQKRCSKGLKDLLMAMVSVSSLNRPTYNQILSQNQRLLSLKTDLKLNHSTQKSDKLFSTASSKKNSQKKNIQQSDSILFQRSQRQRNLLSQLYYPKRK